MTHSFDVIIIGAGAAGLMCAIEAGKRGRRVWLIDYSAKIAEKIRISGNPVSMILGLRGQIHQFVVVARNKIRILASDWVFIDKSFD